MKRGKRTVVKLDLPLEQQPTDLQNTYFKNLPLPNPLSSTTIQEPDLQSEVLQYSSTSNQSNTQPKFASDTQQKRKKIELLKQKYLKKNRSDNNKPQSQIFESQNTSNRHQPSRNQSLIFQNQQKASSTRSVTQQHTTTMYPILPAQKPVQQIQTANQTKDELKVTHLVINNQNKPFKLSTMQPSESQSHQQQISKSSNQMTVKNLSSPPFKKNQPPSLPAKVYQNNFSISKGEFSEKLQVKTVSINGNHQSAQNSNQVNDITERQSSGQASVPGLENLNEKKTQFNVPPPLSNRNLKEMLNKRLNGAKNLPKPAFQFQQNFKQVDDFKNHHLNESTSHPSPTDLQKQQKNFNKFEIDDQYNAELESATNQSSIGQQPKLPQKVNPSRFVGEWLQSPELTLKELFPEIKEVVQFYCLKKHRTLELVSNNPGFTPLHADIIQSFFLNNSIKYTQDQKKVAESVCLNFFYSNASEFNRIFLILLVKMGENYLLKYQKALQDKFQKYLCQLLLYKNLFLAEELAEMINFCLSKGLVRQSNFLLFLMLGQSPQLISFIANSEIQGLRESIGLLSLCKLNIKNKNLLGLYLKIITTIESQIIKNNLAEKILNHLKELDIPEHLYQYTKQLKLKLIRNYQQSQQEDKQQNTQNPQSNTIGQKDSGIFGYFNLNKAIDKIKNSTEKALGTIEKHTKPQQEEKKDDIVYCPVRKRYIINGQIPQDQQTPVHSQQNEAKPKMPPPPPVGVKKIPPPLNSKKPGPRIAANRYT